MIGSFEEHLFAARLQSLPQRQAKDFRLSSAALGRFNIYLAFIEREILANVGTVPKEAERCSLNFKDN